MEWNASDQKPDVAPSEGVTLAQVEATAKRVRLLLMLVRDKGVPADAHKDYQALEESICSWTPVQTEFADLLTGKSAEIINQVYGALVRAESQVSRALHALSGKSNTTTAKNKANGAAEAKRKGKLDLKTKATAALFAARLKLKEALAIARAS